MSLRGKGDQLEFGLVDVARLARLPSLECKEVAFKRVETCCHHLWMARDVRENTPTRRRERVERNARSDKPKPRENFSDYDLK